MKNIFSPSDKSNNIYIYIYKLLNRVETLETVVGGKLGGWTGTVLPLISVRSHCPCNVIYLHPLRGQNKNFLLGGEEEISFICESSLHLP